MSPRLATAWRLSMALVVGPLTLILALVLGFSWTPAAALIPAVGGLLIGGWLWWLLGRRARSFGYVERSADLLVTSGVLFKRLVIVPYGRMQLVDLVAGPIDRALGLSTVKLHTAAATTDAGIPGLTPDEAARLRDRLAALGEQRSAGL